MRRAGPAVLGLVALLGVAACATRSPFSGSAPPPPPPRPLPLTVFAVTFAPAGSSTYPPTGTSEVTLYRPVLNLGSRPPQVRLDEKPARPYVVIGKLRFGENWYSDENLVALRARHVPALGGDAVLTWTIYPTAAAFLPDVGDLFYATYEAEVIRYTDR